MAGTGLALRTAGAEEEVVVEVGVEEVEVVGQGLVAGTPRGLCLERGGPVADWGTSPSVPASTLWCETAGSWRPVQREGEGEEGEGEETLLRSSVEQAREEEE